MRNPVGPSSCVTPADTSNELDVQNKREENTQHTHTHNTHSITVVFSSTLDYTVDPRLLPSGNPFKYHVVVALSLQPMQQNIITTMFDDVLHCFCFVFVFCLVVSLHGD